MFKKRMHSKYEPKCALGVDAVGTINCTFDERLQCGYIDVSEGPQKWTRSYNETRSGTRYVQLLLDQYADSGTPEVTWRGGGSSPKRALKNCRYTRNKKG